MTLPEITAAVDAGRTVYWSNVAYRVIRDEGGQYWIRCGTGYLIGLTWSDGQTLNGHEQDFHLSD